MEHSRWSFCINSSHFSGAVCSWVSWSHGCSGLHLALRLLWSGCGVGVPTILREDPCLPPSPTHHYQCTNSQGHFREVLRGRLLRWSMYQWENVLLPHKMYIIVVVCWLVTFSPLEIDWQECYLSSPFYLHQHLLSPLLTSPFLWLSSFFLLSNFLSSLFLFTPRPLPSPLSSAAVPDHSGVHKLAG